MVEIDYYSKYLKYKQKYLKQKNLQIGGSDINITIIVKEILKNMVVPTIIGTYQNQIFDDSLNIKSSIEGWIKRYNITQKKFFSVMKP